MQTVAAANGLRGGLIALPISRKSPSRRPRTTLIAGAKKADVAAAPPSSPAPTPEDVSVPSYFLPPTPEAGIPQQQSVYQAVPQYPIAPPPAPVKSVGFWSSVPPLVWIGVGILAANVIGSALNFVKGGPQKMQEMAMKTMMDQMMKQAMKGGGPGAAGGNPFAGMPGGFPGGAMPGGFPGGMPGGFPGAGFPGAGFPTPPPPASSASTAAASQPPIDTTASPASSSSPASASTSAGSSSPSSGTRKKSAFKDVDTNASTTTTSSSSNGSASASSSTPPTPPPFTMPPGMNMPPGMGMPPVGGPAGSESASSMLDMLKNPEMQKMLYPYLPEPMRNPETFEWMLNSPEYRAQLEGMLTQQMGGSAPAAVQEMMKEADMSPDKMKEQFDALGMTPEEFVGKVMSDPDLATSMTKPKVMEAIAECTKNPMSIFKYQNDEEVMRVFEKMQALFPQQAGAMPGGMPAVDPPAMTTPKTNPVTLSHQDKASIEAAKQLPWTPPLLPLTFRRPLISSDQPALETSKAAGSPLLLESQEEPVTPRNQGIVMATPGAPLCPPLLERGRQQIN